MSRLFNIGSLCTDFVYSVPSLVRAGETLDSSNRQVFPGGKGLNQSIAAAKAGCEVIHIGAVGPDGDMLVECLETHDVQTNDIHRSEVASGHAFIQVDPTGQNAIVIHGGANRHLPRGIWEHALARMTRGDWLLLQNETNAVDEILYAASEAGINIAINLAPADVSVRTLPLQLATLLIVNEAEAQMLSGCTDIEEAFAQLRARYPDTAVVLTLGRQGLQFQDVNTHQYGRLSAFNVEAVDETAAGDAFVGYFLAQLVAGEALKIALEFASAAGALAVTREGAAPSIPDRSEVKILVREQGSLEVIAGDGA
mgnify:CR=1 FL=1